jgi:hypothetical protein
MSGYEHDIFISYRRMEPEWVHWTQKNFLRPLRVLLRPALGNISIFADNQVETGASWPAHIARAHARSRILIPILSRDYFNSEWCRLELALMHHREKLVGYRTPAHAGVLILPVAIDDGNSFPPEVQDMQAEGIHQFAQPFMNPEGALQEAFAAHLKEWCPRIEQALQSIPPFDPQWETLAHQEFVKRFEIKMATQTTVPGLSLLTIAPEGSPS